MENKAYLADNQDIAGDNYHEDDLPTYEQCMCKWNWLNNFLKSQISNVSSKDYVAC